MAAIASALVSNDPCPEDLPNLIAALNLRDATAHSIQAARKLADLGRAHPKLRGPIRLALRRRMANKAVGSLKVTVADSLARLAPSSLCTAPGAAAPGATQARRGHRTAHRRRGPPVAALKQPGWASDDLDACQEPDWSYDDRDGSEVASWPLDDDGLESLGEIEQLVARYTRLFHAEQALPSFRPTLGAALDEGQRRRLAAAVREVRRPAVHASGALREKVEGWGVALDQVLRVTTVEALAACALLRHEGHEPPWEIDRDAVLAHLCERLAEPPGSAAEAVVVAFHELLVAAPRPQAGRLVGALRRAHEAWLPLVTWLSAIAGKHEIAHVVRLASGSRLVLRNLLANLARPLPASVDGVSEWVQQSAASLLSAGGGAAQGLDYPSFRVVCRASYSGLSAEHGAEMDALWSELERLHLAVCNGSLQRPLQHAFPDLWAELPAGARAGLDERLRDLAVAYVTLRYARPGGPARALRRRDLLRLCDADGEDSARLSWWDCQARHGADALREGLVLALLSELHQPHADDAALQSRLKEAMIVLARRLAATYAWRPLPYASRADDRNRLLFDMLLVCFEHAPLELLQALGASHEQGLPRCHGGHPDTLELRFRKVQREALRGKRAPVAGPERVICCKPLPKEQALARGQLGRDCSSSSVPLRALSPHHVYYGLFAEDGQQLPGYMTVFEAWGVGADGVRRPVLCLETINEPKGLLAGVQQDLLVLFEAIAQARGLGPGLVLSAGHGTWNYSNGSELAVCRRARKGSEIQLFPADPVSWRIYTRLTSEASYYANFEATPNRLCTPDAGVYSRPVVALAPFEQGKDSVHPDNLEEAFRLASGAPLVPRVTCADARGPVGFISDWPGATG